MKTTKKHIGTNILIGLLLGIASNFIGSMLYILLFSKYSLKTTIEVALEEDVMGNIIGLGALLNLLLFFYFLKKNRYYRARGVIMATLLAALLILAAKFY
ncbi:MAG: hypothetical protein R3359_02675 [Marinirhabdus sp.]|nr:hypothetical protein [Marinirhabdus sp.]